MPVSSNSCVAKFLRQKYKRSPPVPYIIYTISHQLMEEITTQNTSTYTRKNYLQIIRTSCFFLLGSLHFLFSKLFHRPQLRTHTHATQAPTAETKNQRRERTSSLPLCRGSNIPGWPTRSTSHYFGTREHVNLFH